MRPESGANDLIHLLAPNSTSFCSVGQLSRKYSHVLAFSAPSVQPPAGADTAHCPRVAQTCQGLLFFENFVTAADLKKTRPRYLASPTYHLQPTTYASTVAVLV